MSEETSLHLLLGARDRRLGVEQDQLAHELSGASTANFQEMETSMV